MSIVSLRSSCREAEFAYLDAVFIGLYFSWPSSSVLSAMRGAQSEHLRSRSQVYALAIVPDFGMNAVSPPSQEGGARDQLLDLSAATAAQFEAATVTNAMVILPKGMAGVLIRTFMSTMLLHPRMRSKLTICSTLADVEASFRRVAGGPPVPVGLASQLDDWLRVKRDRLASQARV